MPCHAALSTSTASLSPPAVRPLFPATDENDVASFNLDQLVREHTGHLCNAPAPSVVYRRVAHAAHDQRGNALWDLEQWDVVQAYAATRPAEVPANAEKHSGYVQHGQQHVLYVRPAPVSEHAGCTICAGLRQESAR